MNKFGQNTKKYVVYVGREDELEFGMLCEVIKEWTHTETRMGGHDGDSLYTDYTSMLDVVTKKGNKFTGKSLHFRNMGQIASAVKELTDSIGTIDRDVLKMKERKKKLERKIKILSKVLRER